MAEKEHASFSPFKNARKIYLTPPIFTVIPTQNLNHVPLFFLKNVVYLNFNKSFAATCQKKYFEHNFKNTNPFGVRPIALESPLFYLSVSFDLASKFTLFLKWHPFW